jgi:hypothetical protein
MAALRNLFQAPWARVLREEPVMGGGGAAVVEVEGMLCQRL